MIVDILESKQMVKENQEREANFRLLKGVFQRTDIPQDAKETINTCILKMQKLESTQRISETNFI